MIFRNRSVGEGGGRVDRKPEIPEMFGMPGMPGNGWLGGKDWYSKRENQLSYHLRSTSYPISAQLK
jgi:hypothetical protein